MQKAYAIKVKGDVQKSAFRRFVKQLAKKHNLFGSVENLDNYDEDVLIICEGEVEGLEKFLHALGNPSVGDRKETTATIEDIETEEIPSTGKFDNFRIVRGPDEIAERLDDGLVIMNKGFSEMNENFRLQREETRNGFGKMDENSKSLRGETKKGFGKTNVNFKSLDGKYGKISAILVKINDNLVKIAGRV
ncbi:MAG: acylphosphatase [Candidatus Diapherotrites archaeon]|uniref:acylphosphatase n=1 Tax=Candidatus Iainarchaeum sp. TaxID=3101447 RepID=A0A8T4KTM2_9ARCH|nr:acylphosphatase [Candidatus Diapherotrites archaeon]